MTGQATVTIGSSSWACSIASLPNELVTGLSNIASIPAGTGMLFDMSTDQSSIVINTSEMLFDLDVVFINSAGQVVGVLSNVEPGDSPTFDTSPLLYFMEVNAGEASGVSVGDAVTFETTSQSFSFSDIMSMMVVMMMMGMIMKAMTGGK